MILAIPSAKPGKLPNDEAGAWMFSPLLGAFKFALNYASTESESVKEAVCSSVVSSCANATCKVDKATHSISRNKFFILILSVGE